MSVQTRPLLEAALEYASIGWPVLPLRPGTKRPLTAHGLKDATTDPAQIRKWWGEFPEANVGGVTENFVVIDVDVPKQKRPEVNGRATLERLEQAHEELPRTWQAITGANGKHFVFRPPNGERYRSCADVEIDGVPQPGLDVRARGGYIVLPPSIVTDYSTNPPVSEPHGEYAWQYAQGPFDGGGPAPLPEWLADKLPRAGETNGAVPRTEEFLEVDDEVYEQLVDALRHLDPDLPYDAWVRVLMALRTLPDQEQAFEIANSWSSKGSKYQGEEDVRKKWSQVSPEGRLTYKSIFHEAQKGGWKNQGSRRAATPAPEPGPLPAGLPAVLPFDQRLLPSSLRAWVSDISERQQSPPDFAAVAAMVSLAGIVGRQLGIRPKRRDDWLVVPNLWGAAIGRPGIMKSPAIQEPLKVLTRLEIKAKEKHEENVMLHQAAGIVAEERAKALRDDVRKAVKNGGDAMSIAESMLEAERDEPSRQRYLVNDATVEKLGEILAGNARGVTVYRDELVGLLTSLDKEGHEGARAFYLEAWNGTGRHTYDRIGRGTIDIEGACVSIIGGIQPGPLGEYLRGAVKGGKGDDGLMQRFQLAVWPDTTAEWKNIDRWPDGHARDRAFDVFARLDKLDPIGIGADVGEESDEVPYLRFSPEAQELFDSWRGGLEKRLRSGEDHPAIEAHLTKYRSLVPSLALLIHVAENCVGPVGRTSLEKAIGWSEYLESHARRIYSGAISLDTLATRALGEHVQAGDLGKRFTLRDAYRPCWRGLASRDAARRGIQGLLDLDWLRERKEETGGRPRTTYLVNPRVTPKTTAKTDKRPSVRASVSSVSSFPAPSLQGAVRYEEDSHV